MYLCLYGEFTCTYNYCNILINIYYMVLKINLKTRMRTVFHQGKSCNDMDKASTYYVINNKYNIHSGE